jgi:hypothetical protein
MTEGLVLYNENTAGFGPAIRFESDHGSSRGIHSAINGNADGDGGALSFHTSADDSTLTRQMIIKPDGKVGIGLPSPGGKLSIYDSTAADYTALRIYQGGDSDYYWDFTADVDAGDLIIGGNHSSFDLILNPTQGRVGIGTTDPSYFLHAETSIADYAVRLANQNSSGGVVNLLFSGVSPDNNTVGFLDASDSTALRLRIYSDGDVANHDGTYGTLSDAKLKQDIEDVRSYWDDFKQLQYRKFRHKTDVEVDADAPYRLGLVAQEVETIFPALVPESPDPDIVETVNVTETVLDNDGEPVLDDDGNETTQVVMIPVFDNEGEPVLDDDGNETLQAKTKEVSTPSGTTHKWVKSSVVEGPIMGSVVQELQTRLEAAESKITALESA